MFETPFVFKRSIPHRQYRVSDFFLLALARRLLALVCFDFDTLPGDRSENYLTTFPVWQSVRAHILYKGDEQTIKERLNTSDRFLHSAIIGKRASSISSL